VLESPLALCDAQSLSEENLVASDLKYPDRTGETYSITYNPNQRYYYFPRMQADEAVLIRCFDSAPEGAARFSAHTGFDDPTAPPDAPPRESLEVRTLVFFPPGERRVVSVAPAKAGV
jgi:FtsP/CotA-like multicopper oxidase with cupredoxin domain